MMLLLGLALGDSKNALSLALLQRRFTRGASWFPELVVTRS